MKCSLYMAIAANGMVATGQGETPWGEASWENFIAFTEKHGNLIIGSTTHKVMKEEGSLDLVRGNPKIVIVSQQAQDIDGADIASSPQDALNLLKDQEVVVLGGGPTLATAFISQDLVDEIYLDVEPVLLGKGMELITEKLNRRLTLLDINQYDVGITLHYKVEKGNG